MLHAVQLSLLGPVPINIKYFILQFKQVELQIEHVYVKLF